MPQMRAIWVEEFGEPDVLEYVDVERPSLDKGEALIEVKSVGVNYADTMRRRNQYVEHQELPLTPGSEIGGTVAEVGEGVEDVNVGDRVVTLLGTGGYTEYTGAPARNLIPIPEKMDFDEAAAIPLQGLTAYHVLETSGQLEEGESVLVHAAAGGVGSLSVQMAKLMGANPVIAAASTQEKLDLAKDLGADVLINYTEDDWTEQVREATDGNGADVILEMVGGPPTEEPPVSERLRANGRLRGGEWGPGKPLARRVDEEKPLRRRVLSTQHHDPARTLRAEPAEGTRLDLLGRPEANDRRPLPPGEGPRSPRSPRRTRDNRQDRPEPLKRSGGLRK
jgi:NADPH:quinone reductase-like Zn-dependent oxidoreductase